MRFARARGRNRKTSYVDGYLRTVTWFRRRDRWFAEEKQRAGSARCIVCSKAGTSRTLELHHLDYARVTRDEDGRWHAGEQHADLVAAHPRCHEWIHQLLDRDRAASGAVNRRQANIRVIRRLRAKFADQIQKLEEWGHDD